ncbi:MAG: DMT family transporter [Lysobacter spongiicola]|nr:DMT family transporter [Lysobacter spongiicola]
MPARDLVLILVICIAWAGNFLASAHALQEIPPFLYTAIRMAILAAILAVMIKPPAKGQWPRLLAVAICNNVLHFGLSFWALKMAGNLSSVAIVMQSYVPMSAVLAWVVLGERFGWRTATAIVVSFGGILVLGFDPLVLDRPLSLAMMLVSAAFLALGTVLMRRLTGLGMVSQQGWSAVISVLPLFGLSLLLEPGGLAALADATWVGWTGALYSALIASLLGHGLYFVLVQRHPIAKLTPWLLLTPILAVVLGIVFWGDRPGPQLWIGGAMVLGGVLMIALRAKAKARPLPPAKEI